MEVKVIKNVVIFLVIVSMLCLVSCSSNTSSTNNTSNATPNSNTTSSNVNASKESSSSGGENASEFVYPIKGNPVLTYFGPLHQKVASYYSGYDDLAVVKKWFEKTGVTLKFNTPPAGMEKEQFNIMLASGDYTDIICYDFMGLPGGPQKLYNDGVIIKLTDYMKKYAPNLMKYLDANPQIRKQVVDDKGDFYLFPFLKGGGYLLATTGPMLRDDMLKKLSLAPPETIEEWDAVLQAVKDNYPGVSPFVGNFDTLVNCFQPAYGVSTGLWYMDEKGTVHFSPLEKGYEDFLKQMHDWYARGLLDSNLATLDTSGINNAMTSGAAFATFGAGSSGMGAYLSANANNKEYSLMGVHLPTLKKGELAKYVTEYEFGSNPQVAISTKCKNIEAAVRMYDWGFSEEGHLMLNWGIEGESFTYDQNGKPHYTDLILKNPNGLSVDAILAQYAMVAIKGPAMLVQDPDYILEYYNKPAQQAAMKAWSIKDFETRVFPPVSYTTDESSKLASIMADLQTYVESMSLKFIIGSESFDKWDSFINTIKGMNVSGAIAIQQAAVNRYNAR